MFFSFMRGVVIFLVFCVFVIDDVDQNSGYKDGFDYDVL